FATAPGLTGLWQVSGKNRTTFDEMIQLDLRYAQRLSLGLDLLIILRTPWAVWVQISDTRKSKKAANESARKGPPQGESRMAVEENVKRPPSTPSANPWVANAQEPVRALSGGILLDRYHLAAVG